MFIYIEKSYDWFVTSALRKWVNFETHTSNRQTSFNTSWNIGRHTTQ